MSRSEKPIGDNRALHVRRDTDTQKNITIGFYDIDETINIHLNRLNLQVVDGGEVIKVPIMYGSPEIWTTAKRDGYLRDKQGKIQLPAIVFKRTSSENDVSLQYFNRYLTSAVMKKYSTKNKYTQFSVLVGQNAPVNEVYNIVFPSHMLITYHFIVWTEYVQQMNKLIENIQFNTKDYWGNAKGFKFRTRVESYVHTTELQVGEDRVVKTEFDLTTHGYILPETITTLENQKSTMIKMFTPKKIILNVETVASDYDFSELDTNAEKWRNQAYPNLPKSEEIESPGVGFPATSYSINEVTIEEGTVAFDREYFYVYVNNIWRRIAISLFIGCITNSESFIRHLRVVNRTACTSASNGHEYDVAFDEEYFYIFIGGEWKRVAISEFTNLDDVIAGIMDTRTYFTKLDVVSPPYASGATGKSGNISVDEQYFYIYTSGEWKHVAISQFS